MDPERVERLLRDLSAFEPVADEQAFAREQMRGLLRAAAHGAFSRDHLEPGHFTASGFVLDPTGAQLLLIFHRKLRLWLQPGGHFELGDVDHVAAARRELEEEVGLGDLELLSPLYDLDVHTIPESPKEGAHLHFDLRVLFRARTPTVQASDEVLDARYFSLAELSEPAAGHVGSAGRPGSDPSVVRVARRLLGSA